MLTDLGGQMIVRLFLFYFILQQRHLLFSQPAYTFLFERSSVQDESRSRRGVHLRRNI